ncbi:hypothetical protein [Candidatus Nitrotoga fabula]|uniref:Mor domain-containing protein n=1 Tax=Candidatus Nitrotoga fabula TaxID=2182327 RepID=A0A916FBB0_9PROT|nr:hypothetical protein [Candidatus Nitrotoga fabula]CAE6723415.1 Mor domain-containing protein [Candidatus Nitrotoga fabula]
MDNREPDIVTVILQRVAEVMPGMSDDLVHQVEDEVRREYGGQRWFVPKRRKHLTHEQRNNVFKDGLSNMPTKEIVQKHKISQATLYRLMKTGGRFSNP